MRNVPVAVWIVLAVVVLLLLKSTAQVVSPGHRGVKVTMGKVNPTPLGEGVALTMPLGITRVIELNVQQQKAEGETPCFSSDLQTVIFKYAVMYRLNAASVVSLYQDFRGDPYDSLVAPRVQEALKQVTARYTAEGLVQKREIVREETRTLLRQAIGDKIEIVDFNVMNIDLSDQLEHAIEQKMVQQQTSLKKEFELASERKEAEIVAVRAEAEAKAVKIRGEALMSNPLAIQMEIIKKWNGIAPQVVMLGGGSGATAGAPIVLPLIPAAPTGGQ
jgi:prohibitin 2